jgi:UDP-N-acetylmuramoyl-L-alanyl-D-glutamate--2,6-diaminopimelate ligase
MTLNDLFANTNIKIEQILYRNDEIELFPKIQELNLEIENIQSDSRKITKNSLFIAIRGFNVDGHEYIKAAIKNGAIYTICEVIPSNINGTFIKIKDTSEVIGSLASNFFGNPSHSLKVVGVTGTNGKTTVATLLYKMFRKLGYKAGLLSTVCNYIDDYSIEAFQTTPDAITIQSLMFKMVKKGCDFCFMEVSSHSIDQKRINGIKFAGGIFTNLSRDHLDYHLTMDNYLKTKKKFFDNLPNSAFALTNIDDKVGKIMIQNTRAKYFTYALNTDADFKGRIIDSNFFGSEMEINGINLFTHFTGRFNAYNILSVFGASILLGCKLNEALVTISELLPVTGRFETFLTKDGKTAIVDYAHTPDAISNVLDTIKEITNGNGKIITVIGAGGNRDKGKRPLMAKAAASKSNILILTSDNPRFENPDKIIEDMSAGIINIKNKSIYKISDRKKAIKSAFMLANNQDIILIAGKGHENYQEINGIKYPFDDRVEVIEMINN